MLEGTEHVCVAQHGIAADLDAVGLARIPAVVNELTGRLKSDRGQLASVDRLAEACFRGQWEQRKATQQRDQPAEVLVSIGAHLAIDEGGAKDAARHLQSRTRGEQLLFCGNKALDEAGLLRATILEREGNAVEDARGETRVQWAQAKRVCREGQGSVTLAIVRNGDKSKACSVEYCTKSGTATDGVDFEHVRRRPLMVPKCSSECVLECLPALWERPSARLSL